MSEMKLERQEFTDKQIIGSIYVDGDFICYSLERPWLDNAANISCIPEGIYDLQYHKYKGRLDTYALIGKTVSHYPSEKARNLILIHPANRVEELQGCIATGTDKKDGDMVMSIKAHKKLMNAVKSKNITKITIL